MKDRYKIVLTIIITAIVCITGTVFATTYFDSKDVSYDNTNSDINSTNVQDAIDELSRKVGSGGKYTVTITSRSTYDAGAGFDITFFEQTVKDSSGNILKDHEILAVLRADTQAIYFRNNFGDAGLSFIVGE